MLGHRVRQVTETLRPVFTTPTVATNYDNLVLHNRKQGTYHYVIGLGTSAHGGGRGREELRKQSKSEIFSARNLFTESGYLYKHRRTS